MKLYDIPKGSKIKLQIMHEKEEKEFEEMCTFHHLDGMYSYITTEDGSVVHLGAVTELKKVNNHYELI